MTWPSAAPVSSAWRTPITWRDRVAVPSSWSDTRVDPRAVLARLPDWLQQAQGVDFAFGCLVVDYDRPTVRTTTGDWEARQLVVCNGDDFQTLYPSLFPADQFVRCKLQMMRSA